MFKSFMMAGFEGATGRNRHGDRIDQVVATQHDRFVELDYELLRRHDILAARDVIRWPLVDRRGRYDFASVAPVVRASRRRGIDVVWDLFHYGYPDDVDLFSSELADRFASYCAACARYITSHTEGPWHFTPINEPSYFAWAAGEAALFAPHQRGRGPELKLQLARAGLAGIRAIRAVCPSARIVNVDPICRVVPPRGLEDDQETLRAVASFNEGAVYESWDMLAGRLRPELGGSRELLDVVGVNYYWTNQWELGCEGCLAEGDQRACSLGDLVRQAWQRYGGDVLITETMHRDDARPAWLLSLAGEVSALRQAGVGLRGLCLYPVLGMPEWHEPEVWTRMGLWDLVPQSPELGRIPHRASLDALGRLQDAVEPGALRR